VSSDVLRASSRKKERIGVAYVTLTYQCVGSRSGPHRGEKYVMREFIV
jgi:hypothetical protein